MDTAARAMVAQLQADRACPQRSASACPRERFEYANVLAGPEGPIRAEVQLIYIWLDQPVLVGLMPRMSAGRMMGCAFNRTEPWTGHGVAFWPR